MSRPHRLFLAWGLVAALLAGACATEPTAKPDAAATVTVPPAPEGGTRVRFDLAADLGTFAGFWDQPWPSDLRRTASGAPDVRGLLPNDAPAILTGLRDAVLQGEGASLLPAAWFRFSAALAVRDEAAPLPTTATAAVLLIDVDPDSPERGHLVPIVARTLPIDRYTPEHVLGVIAKPGYVLAPNRTYAVVIRRSLGDVQGQPLGVPEELWTLTHGGVPAGAQGKAAALVFAPLLPVLAELGVAPAEIAAATVFTTGDPVLALYELSEALRKPHAADIQALHLDGVDGAQHPRFCELHGTLQVPQFQQGEPPFNQHGLFVPGPDGLPVVQRQEVIPVVVTLPKQPMPAGGYPLVLYFHGSGGVSTQVVDRSAEDAQGHTKPGEGPAHVLAAHGMATAGSAHPLNPERLPGASSYAYLNFVNPKVFRDTFRQGVIEQRLYLDALLRLRIPPAALAGCQGPTLSASQDAFRFADSRVMAMGQSMGGMYANLVSAVDPRIGAVVPTGAGGYWSWFVLETSLVPAGALLAGLIDTEEAVLSRMHPGLHLLQTAWEPAEPLIYVPRLGRDPLPGQPVRHVYEPVGQGDEYFPEKLFDAIAMAYGHHQAGEQVWPGMQPALQAAGQGGVLQYPVQANRKSRDGRVSTGVVVQYPNDGILDGHHIFAQLDAVKHQYGCFFATFWQTGTAVVPAPAPLGSACAGM